MKLWGKKLFLGILIPALAFTAMTGTGFGLWTFANTDSVSPVNMKQTQCLTSVVSYSDINPSYSGTLVIDESGTTFKDITLEISPIVEVAANGIEVYYDADGTKHETEYDVPVTDLSFTCYIDCALSSPLNKYIDCKYVHADGKVKNNDPISCTVNTSNSEKYYYDSAVGKYRAKFTFNPEFEWVNHPSSLVAFNKMYDELMNATNIITFTITVIK